MQVEHGIEHLPHGYIKLLKTQDQAYVNMKRAQDAKVRVCLSVPTVSAQNGGVETSHVGG
jgi:hypothetical protein